MNVKGTGIGLTLAAEIVRAHGGRLEVDSQPGRGSRFTTFLPIQGTPL
jgi:signal transduction histidine kinase